MRRHGGWAAPDARKFDITNAVVDSTTAIAITFSSVITFHRGSSISDSSTIFPAKFPGMLELNSKTNHGLLNLLLLNLLFTVQSTLPNLGSCNSRFRSVIAYQVCQDLGPAIVP